MRFTLELPALIKMVQQAGKKMPGQKRADQTLRLYACAARVFVESNQTVAGMEALVLKDGGCTLPREVFLKLLKSYAPKPHITIEADERTVRFGSTTLNSVGYSPTATPPGHFQVFPVTDLKALFPDKPATTSKPPIEKIVLQQSPAQSPAPAEPDEDFENVHQIVARITRKLLALATATPQQIVGLARALYALERLPETTPGVDVTYDISERMDLASGAYSVHYYEIAISDKSFVVQSGSCGASAGESSEGFAHTAFEEYPLGLRFQLSPSEDEWVELFQWAEGVEELLKVEPSEALRLDVKDESSPDCIAPAPS
ncbi:MAG: hypothetical protein EXS24_07440 [Pedosphaera sp.]|nr:hypothetical protein [Pedosphaera sp.]